MKGGEGCREITRRVSHKSFVGWVTKLLRRAGDMASPAHVGYPLALTGKIYFVCVYLGRDTPCSTLNANYRNHVFFVIQGISILTRYLRFNAMRHEFTQELCRFGYKTVKGGR